jgi:hypothetical protein
MDNILKYKEFHNFYQAYKNEAANNIAKESTRKVNPEALYKWLKIQQYCTFTNATLLICHADLFPADDTPCH